MAIAGVVACAVRFVYPDGEGHLFSWRPLVVPTYKKHCVARTMRGTRNVANAIWSDSVVTGQKFICRWRPCETRPRAFRTRTEPNPPQRTRESKHSLEVVAHVCFGLFYLTINWKDTTTGVYILFRLEAPHAMTYIRHFHHPTP